MDLVYLKKIYQVLQGETCRKGLDYKLAMAAASDWSLHQLASP